MKRPLCDEHRAAAAIDDDPGGSRCRFRNGGGEALPRAKPPSKQRDPHPPPRHEPSRVRLSLGIRQPLTGRQVLPGLRQVTREEEDPDPDRKTTLLNSSP